MIILLDTNAFVWWLLDDPHLGPKAKREISSSNNSIYISNLSLLECSIKTRIGKLKISFDVVDEELSDGKFIELKYDTLAARQFVNQKSLPQSDPFNTALVAQAITKHMLFMTSDAKILDATIDDLLVISARK